MHFMFALTGSLFGISRTVIVSKVPVEYFDRTVVRSEAGAVILPSIRTSAHLNYTVWESNVTIPERRR